MTTENINACLLLPTINERKSFYGKPITKFLQQYKRVVCQVFPRGGKSYMGLDCIQKVRGNKPNATIGLVVPSDIIRKEWQGHFDRLGIGDIDLYSISQYMSDETIVKNYDFFIVDEVHKVLGASEVNSQVIPTTTAKYMLVLSATLTPEMLNKLEGYGFPFRYHLPLETGYMLDVIPEFISYNIPVQLTSAERFEYKELQKDYKFYYDMFYEFDSENTIDVIKNCIAKKPFVYKGKFSNAAELVRQVSRIVKKSEGVVRGYASEFMSTMRARSELLYKAKNKMHAFQDLISRLPVDEKKIIFTYKTDYADQIAGSLPSSKAFHSNIKAKQKRETMEAYNKDEFANIVTCKSLDEGFTSPVKIAIRMFFDSTQGKTTQTLGRLLLKNEENPDEVATVFTFYVDDFVMDNVQFYSQEKKWLKSSQYSLMFVKWVRSVDEIPFKTMTFNNGSKELSQG